MQWYYANQGQQQGPVSQAEFEQLVRDEVIAARTLVWRQGMAEWRPYENVFPGGVPVANPNAGTGAVGGLHLPLAAGVPPPGQFVYAGFWVRFVAKILDALIIAAFSAGVDMLVALRVLGSPNYLGRAMLQYPLHDRLVYQAITFPLGVGIAIAYACFFILRWDATPGKMALGLKLVRSDGSRLSAGRIVGRYFSEWLSALIFCIGYIMVAFDDEKRALHDHICDTRVIRAK